ncbi:tyrosine-type recombinase/integrase [Thalassobaculum litoreum]|nr:site-specific integrase [Thalassobaculum litoreum]
MTTTTKPSGTYADLLDDITALQDIADTKKKELIAAARFMAEKVIALGIAAPIDIAMLNSKLASISATTFGLKKASFQNIKSRFRSALKLTGRDVMPGKHTSPLTPEWQAVITLIPTKKRARPISRLAHFASKRGWSPSEIDDEKMALFEIGLKSAITPHAAQVYGRTCKALNDFAAQVEGWPIPAVTPPTPSAAKSVTWSELPEHLTSEAETLFEAKRKSATGVPSLLSFETIAEFTAAEASGQGRPWADATVGNYRYALQRHLSVLVRIGPIDTVKDLRAALNANLVLASVKYIINQDGRLCWMHFRIAAALTAIGSAVGLGDHDLKALRALEMNIHKKLGGGSTGLSEKANKVLAATANPETRFKLLTLPQTLMTEAIKIAKDKPARAARTMRSAAALEILIVAAIRMKNLLALRLDKHFLNWADSSADKLIVLIPGSETKGGKGITFELPAPSSTLIRTYVIKYRGRLPGAESPWLFPGTKGSHLDKTTIREQLQRSVLEKVGIKIHMHAFRHVMAQILLDAYPTAYQTVSTILGHSSLDTTTKYYSSVDQKKAMQVYDDLIANLRGGKKNKKS